MQAVTNNGKALFFVTDEKLKEDKELVLAACKTSGMALKLASKAL